MADVDIAPNFGQELKVRGFQDLLVMIWQD